ncbi:MAG: hypothetical protein ABEK16_03070, partial [Candidatus Nanohalobium sp.]
GGRFKKMHEPLLDMELGKLDEAMERFSELDDLYQDIFFVGVCFLIIGLTAAAHNIYTPDDPVNVGYVEVQTNCFGVEAGSFCIGAERQTHTTYNYDNYTEVEPGTANFYRRVEAELMAQAYNICTTEMNGMEWTDEASYRNQTATQWLENDQVELLPCEQTFYREINATR